MKKKVIVLATWITCISTCQAEIHHDRPLATLNTFAPAPETELVYGTEHEFKADVSLVASAAEAIEFSGQLTVNGKPLAPYKTMLTAAIPTGDVAGQQTMYWQVPIRGPQIMAARFELTGIGQTTRTRYQFSQVNSSYLVKCNPKSNALKVSIQRLFCKCR